MNKKKGMVYITGAGPGDEKLITIKGLYAIQKADVIVYDNLINENLLNRAKENCVKIYAGKKEGRHELTQEEINALLVKKAEEGNVVCRLKGGDPFIFGRGGEEALCLKENGILFEIIPCITSSIAAGAYCGIPLTHRGISAEVTFITGHETPDKEESQIDFEALSKIEGTLVFYMGVKNLSYIAESLIKNKKDPLTPACVIQNATFNNQKIITGALSDIAAKADEQKIKPPCIIIIGEVVKLNEKLNWFENKILFNKNILITRSKNQNNLLKEMLCEYGANVIDFPVINITKSENIKNINKAIKNIETYDRIIFTSENSVNYFFEFLFDLKKDARALSQNKIAVIGSETKSGLLKYGIIADLTPENFTSKDLIETFKKLKIGSNEKILIPTSNIGGDILKNGLNELNAEVDTVEFYCNKAVCYDEDKLKKIFDKSIDLITFTSPSTVDNFCGIMNNSGRKKLLKKFKCISIGPETSKAIIKHKLNLTSEAKVHSIEGLIFAITDYFK